MNGQAWTAAENDWLRINFETTSLATIACALGRSFHSVAQHMRYLGLRKRKVWTAKDDLRLELGWGSPIVDLSVELGRTAGAIEERARFLGFAGVPKGGELLTHAAARCGFSRDQLRSLLKWAAVELHPVTPSGKRKKSRRHWVDKCECDDAVAKWARSETMNAAAKRLGVGWPTVARKIQMSGLKVPPRPMGRKTWRIPSDLIDRAFAIRKAA